MQSDTASCVVTPLQQFAKRFLTGRINWQAIPRTNAIINFGNIISFVIYRKGQYQVELFIVPHKVSSFTNHRHPNVEVIEFPLSGVNTLFVNGKEAHTDLQAQQWLSGEVDSPLVPIHLTDYHSGTATMPYAFLSIQLWLNDISPTSVGLDWIGAPSSMEQEALWLLDKVV